MINEKLVIGSEEWCAFPTLGIPAIKARVDSGVKTSSIHASDIRTFKRDSKIWVSFEIHPLQMNRKTSVRCEAPLIDRRYVKSSSGTSEKRYVIRVPMNICENIIDVEVTLTNRDSMGYRMLLGREAMQNRMLVDPSESFILGSKTNEEINELYGKSQLPVQA